MLERNLKKPYRSKFHECCIKGKKLVFEMPRISSVSCLL